MSEELNLDPETTSAEQSAEQPTEEAKPARAKRARSASRVHDAAQQELELSLELPDDEPPAEKPAPKRRRTKKAVEQEDAASAEQPAEEEKPRRRGRPRKVKAEESTEQAVEAVTVEDPAEGAEQPQEDAPTPRRRGRPRKKVDDATSMTRVTDEATKASAEVLPAPAATISEAEGSSDQPSEQQDQPQGGRNKKGKQDDSRQGQQDQPRQGRNKNRNRNRRGFLTEPTLSREVLQEMKVAELREKAAEVGVDSAGKRKAELVEEIYTTAAKAEGFGNIEGVLEIARDGFSVVRTGNYMQGDNDAMVPQQLVKSLGLRAGDYIVGTVRPGRPQDRYAQVNFVETINGLQPAQISRRPRFRDLTPVFPDERLVMENGRDSITGRAIDLVSPIGKGQRGLIVSPPKAGKTTVLKRICQSIAANNPEVHLFCLLVDERPEEVTDMQRSIKGTVVASTFDMPASNHTAVAELVIERAKRLVEMGEDVVVVLDSITRLARAYNLAMPASGRILSGGVDSAALYPPKKFLGAARNIEGGGSLTILASALVETGSKMDEVIFEEFKGTGNMELKLDRSLADRRVFPAIDCVASGTRNEELLIESEMQPFVWGIRRILANMNNIERSTGALIKGLKATDNNQEFLIRSAKKAQQSEFADAL